MKNQRKTTHEIIEGIAKHLYASWPQIPTQKEIAVKLGIQQSKVSEIMSGWKEKADVPLKLSYQGRNIDLEEKIKNTYGLKDVSVFPSARYLIHTKAHFDQIGACAADILIKKRLDEEINKKISLGNPLSIRISGSCGRSVSSTIMHLAKELKDTEIKLELSSCTALRSDSLIELSPLHIVAQLLDPKLNIEVTHTYQLPKLSAYSDKTFEDNETLLYDIIAQRIKTQTRLEFDNNIIHNSDIVIFGLGSTNFRSLETAKGFGRHINNEGLYSLISALSIEGEVAYAPFNKNGFLFHHLAKEVFIQKNGKFKYNKEGLISKLREFAIGDVFIGEKHLIQAVNLFSSIFTLNFCKLQTAFQDNKKPYVLLVVGGDTQKISPLVTLLTIWKGRNILDGLVTSENIAEGLVDKST